MKKSRAMSDPALVFAGDEGYFLLKARNASPLTNIDEGMGTWPGKPESAPLVQTALQDAAFLAFRACLNFSPMPDSYSDLSAFGPVGLRDQGCPGGNGELLAVFFGSSLVFAFQVRGEELPAVATKHAGDVEGLLKIMKDTLSQREKISSLVDSGKFSPRQKRARRGRNPQTKEEITLAARKVLVFKASGVLRKRINSTSDKSAGVAG